MELGDFKVRYSKLQEKYKLVDFSILNECFEIDRFERNTDYLLREIRKLMMDKIVSYMRFVEMIISPANAPPMFLMFLKNVTDKEKKMLEEVYKGFVQLEIGVLKLEIKYSEKGEAEMINKIFNSWSELRSKLNSFIEVMERNWNSVSSKKEKSYFG